MKTKFFTDSQTRIETIDSLDFTSVTAQLIGYLKFLESDPEVKVLLEKLLSDERVEKALNESSSQMPPELKTLEEIASACVFMLEAIRQKNDATVLYSLGIRGYNGETFASIPNEFARRYLRPFHNYLILISNHVDMLDEFQLRLTTLLSPQFQEVSFRVTGLWGWLIENQTTKVIIERILSCSQADKILAASSFNEPPQTESPDDIIAVGLLLMQECANGAEIFKMTYSHGIRPNYASTNFQDSVDAVLEKFIMPAISHIEKQLRSLTVPPQLETGQTIDIYHQAIPSEINESLKTFRMEHPGSTAFIMMQFAKTETHREIVDSIKSTLTVKGITALRADDHQYHDDVFPNVKTYMHGCDFGVAVFERIEDDVFNPNVSLEVGYLLALGKPICYLKDKSLKQLPTDLISKLYREFDTHAIQETLPSALLKWLREKAICQV